jgi:hypothetical protein
MRELESITPDLRARGWPLWMINNARIVHGLRRLRKPTDPVAEARFLSINARNRDAVHVEITPPAGES